MFVVCLELNKAPLPPMWAHIFKRNSYSTIRVCFKNTETKKQITFEGLYFAAWGDFEWVKWGLHRCQFLEDLNLTLLLLESVANLFILFIGRLLSPVEHTHRGMTATGEVCTPSSPTLPAGTEWRLRGRALTNCTFFGGSSATDDISPICLDLSELKPQTPGRCTWHLFPVRSYARVARTGL